MKREPLVIGIGQPMRGMDGAGWQMAAHFQSCFPGQACVIQVIQLTPELAEIISRHPAVAFVDARVDRMNLSVLLEPISEAGDDLPTLSHVASPAEILAYARGVFGNAPPAVLVTVPAQESELTFPEIKLDEAVMRAATEQIQRWFTAVLGRTASTGTSQTRGSYSSS